MPKHATTHVPPPRQRVFLPRRFGERVRGAAWSVVRLMVFRFSPPPMNWWRIFLLRLFGAKVHHTVFIAPSAIIEQPWNLQVAKRVCICHEVIINCAGDVVIGAGTHISQYAHLCAATHEYHRPDMRIKRSPIDIGKNVWIAADAFVGPGVTLGDGCLLAARSSAFSDLPAGKICIGEPARAVKDRFTTEENETTDSHR